MRGVWADENRSAVLSGTGLMLTTMCGQLTIARSCTNRG